jgi:ferrochelatase
MCPGFTSDCLETLEEIAMEAKTDFLEAGGSTFHYIPCLNEAPEWIEAMADVVEQHTGGWPTAADAALENARQADAQTARLRALEIGAAQ